MRELRLEWHENKARDNYRKHRVSFEEAKTVFYDDEALLLPDPDHSEKEDRSILLGLSWRLRILVVCHCHRAGGEVIRIISARKAIHAEKAEYAERCSR